MLFYSLIIIVQLYDSGIIVHTHPGDVFRMCFGVNVSHITYINDALQKHVTIKRFLYFLIIDSYNFSAYSLLQHF